MCDESCLEFIRRNLNEEDIRGRPVIEVGALDINGSARPIVEAFHPGCYIGVDIEKGPGVDEICDARNLVERFGHNRFELLISTELLEHVRDWRKAINNFKNVIKPNGLLLITTRSKGFGYHGCPFDFWRFEVSDIEQIFSDFIIETIEEDKLFPGVFLKARKPELFSVRDTGDLHIYSMLTRKRVQDIRYLNIFQLKLFYTMRPILSKILPAAIRNRLKKYYKLGG
jgi:SAM-dependent methyltransferase